MTPDNDSIVSEPIQSIKKLIGVFESYSKKTPNSISSAPAFTKLSSSDITKKFEKVKSDKMGVDKNHVAVDLEQNVSVKSLVFNFQKMTKNTPSRFSSISLVPVVHRSIDSSSKASRSATRSESTKSKMATGPRSSTKHISTPSKSSESKISDPQPSVRQTLARFESTVSQPSKKPISPSKVPKKSISPSPQVTKESASSLSQAPPKTPKTVSHAPHVSKHSESPAPSIQTKQTDVLPIIKTTGLFDSPQFPELQEQQYFSPDGSCNISPDESPVSARESNSRSYDLTTGLYVVKESSTKENYSDDESFEGSRLGLGITPLPVSYKVLSKKGETLNLKLPDPPKNSCINPKKKTAVSVKFSEEKHVSETYNKEEYQRSMEDIDYVTARAEYEIEKMLDRMNMINVTLTKNSPDEKLGLSIYGVVIQTISEQNNSAIFVKSVIPGSLCDLSGKVHVDDLLVEINGIPLIGLPVSKVYEIIQSSKTTIQFVLGRERKESDD